VRPMLAEFFRNVMSHELSKDFAQWALWRCSS